MTDLSLHMLPIRTLSASTPVLPALGSSIPLGMAKRKKRKGKPWKNMKTICCPPVVETGQATSPTSNVKFAVNALTDYAKEIGMEPFKGPFAAMLE